MRNIIIILLVACGFSMQANTIEITGNITDKSSNEPVAYALVHIENTNFHTQTNEEGIFSVAVPQAENYTITIYHLNYDKVQLEWNTQQRNDVTIALVPKDIHIEEILVHDHPIQKSAQTDIIQDNMMEISQAVDVGDMFKNIAGFGVIKRGGYAMDPVFRSFKYEQLNLVYDGGVQITHACPNRMDPATTHVMPEEIEKIEIIKGPFSVRYGQTMGGVINLVTQAPNQHKENKIYGSLEGGYEFNGNSKLTRLSLGGSQKGLDFFVNGGLKQYGNYKNGDGIEVPSSFNTYDYATKLGWSPAKNQRLQLNWRQSYGRDILHAGLPMDTELDNSSIASLDYSIKNISSKINSFTAKIYGSNVKHIMTNELRPNRMMVEAIAEVYAQTAGGRAELQVMPSSKSLLYLGGDVRYVGRDGTRNRTMLKDMMGNDLPMPMTMTDLIWQDTRLMDVGLFAEQRFYMNEKTTFAGGLRLDVVQSTINNPAQDFSELYTNLDGNTDFNVGGNISLNYEASKNTTLQIALGRGTRSATIAERYINHFAIGNDGFEYIGNPNLKPEANHQAEVSIQQRLGKVSLSGSVFYSYLTNYITAAVDSTLPRKYMPMSEPRFSKPFQNIDAAIQTGFEISGQWQTTDNLQLYGTLAYTYAQNLDWDEALAEVPPLEGNIGTKYETEKFWADARGRFVATQNRFAPSFGETETPSFATADIRVGYRPIDNLSIGAAILNIFDATYYEHLNRNFTNMGTNSVIYEAGRNISLFVKYGF